VYHPKVIAERFAARMDVVRQQWPDFDPRQYTLAETESWDSRLRNAYDPVTKKQLRDLTEEETRYIVGEMIWCRSDFRYWVERRAKIPSDGGSLITIPLRRTQQIILKKLADLEVTSAERNDGVLALCLKARQLGVSTLSELLIAHKAAFYSHRSCMIASDIPTASGHLFDMVERVYRNQEIVFGQIDSRIRVGWGNATRGQKGQARARLGQGSTIHAIHCSELSSWATPQQLDSSVNPALPRHQNTFGLYEGTALGRGTWLHETWKQSVKGNYRFRPIFIPWAVEVEKYSMPAPLDWAPTSLSLQHATHVEHIMREWCGINLALTKDQLFWYETTREDYAARRQLHAFLAEFAADPESAFQHSGTSYYPPEVLAAAHERARKMEGLAEVKLDPTIDWMAS
jgi:hypothetical protein